MDSSRSHSPSSNPARVPQADSPPAPPHAPPPPHTDTLPHTDPPPPRPLGLGSGPDAATRAHDIVFFGGSFDPPHRAHIRLAALARDLSAGPDAWLVCVPAARSPLKTSSPTPARDRLAMLKLAIGPLRRAVIWTDEIDRARADPDAPSYWIDTLVRARQVLADRFDPLPRLRFILGSDQVVAFDRWHRFREILALATPIVMLRPPMESPESLVAALDRTGVWSRADLDRWASWIVPTPIDTTSATEIRSLLATLSPRPTPHPSSPSSSQPTRSAPQPAPRSASQPPHHPTPQPPLSGRSLDSTSPASVRTQLAAMLEPQVLEYIIEHHLYDTPTD